MQENNNRLQDSEFTHDSSDTSNTEASSTWFGGVGNDFFHIANCLSDNFGPVVSGVADLVHKTAVAVSNEIAQLERESEVVSSRDDVMKTALSEKNSVKNSENDLEQKSTQPSSTAIGSIVNNKDLHLPWEICKDSKVNKDKAGHEKNTGYFTDIDLMGKIMKLSLNESTFYEPFSKDSRIENDTNASLTSSSNFVMDNSIKNLTRRILDADENLVLMYNQLTGNGGKGLEEELFWKNYFFHCENIRAMEFKSRKLKTNCIVEFDDIVKNVKRAAKTESEGILKNNSNGSLIHVDSDTQFDQTHDDTSYVIQSAPNSMNTFATTRSIDDEIVLVENFSNLYKN